MVDGNKSLLPFVPKLALRLLRGTSVLPNDFQVEPVNASVLLADLYGFTSLVDTLAGRYGDRGAEKLQEILNQCFGPLTDIVEAAGGEVLGFPGDAALAIWIASDSEGPQPADLVHASAMCGLELQSRLDRFRVDGLELRLRVAIDAGRSSATLVGGVDGRWETVLQGGAVAQLRDALDAARPGEVVLSPAAGELAADRLLAERRGTQFLVTGGQGLAPRRAPRLDHQPAANEALVRGFVPEPVLSRVDAGQGAWLAEFRTVTVIFVQIANCDGDDHVLLHRTIRVVQSVVARFAGSINQILVDDKGLTVVVAFGVVRRAHEDDATRAVRSSLAVRDELSPLRADVRLGVATGRVFTGTRGGASRHEFAILGSSVVLAARLASVAEDILCDAPTRAASRKVIRFGPSRQFDLKGKADAVDAWRPLAIKADLQRGGIVGRRDELAVLERRLTELARDGKGGAVIIEGEPGIGKTALINELLKWAQSRAMRSLAGAGDSIELRTTYLAWRSVAAGLVGSDAMAEPEVLRRRLIDLLGPENARWVPLLHSVFAVPQLGDDDTLSMSAESRAQTTRELLVKLLEGAARSTPLLIVLEDAHWMDSASWELAEQAVNRIPRLLLLASVRPLVERIQPLEHLKRRSDAMTIHLGALNHEEIRELVCRRLEAEAIPDQLATLVNRRAEGHPLYAQELSLALRDSGAIVVRDGTCRLMAEVSGGGDTSLPDTVQGIVATRIDQLTPQQQLTLKVAAVLGRQFSLTDLAAVHPVSKDRTVVEQQALGIAQAGLLHRLHQRADLFAFAHALVQEVAYESMPYSQRRELHQQAAAWLERVPGRTLDELLPVLAYHWERSEVADKAIYYLEKAGERALERDSSNREAEDFLTRLIALATAMPRWPVPGTDAETAGGARRVALARWERMLSQALGRQGRHAPAMTHLERSIRLLGHTVPSATFTCRLEYGGGVVLRLLWRPSRKPPRRRSATDHLRLLELTRAYESFVQLLYLGSPASSSGTRRSHDVPLLSGVAVLRSLRAAERAGPSAELSRSYSIFSNVVAMFRRAKLSSFYSGRGRALAEATSDKHALFCALTIGQLPSFIRGDWEQVTSALHEALVLGGVLRNVHDCLINEGVLAYVSFNQGHLEEALTRFRDIGVRARQHDHLVPQLWALVSIGEVAFRQGRWDDAIASADACLELADRMETIDQNSRFQAHGLLISAWIRKQRLERAWPHVDRAIDAAEAGARLSYTPQFGFIGVAEALLTVWDRGGDDAPWAAARLRRWLRTLRLMAFCRPILQPWDLVFRASWNCRRGRRRLATRQLRKAIRLADAMGLAYESALARADLARLLARNDPRRNLILEQACATFTAIGATAQLHETQALRSTTPS